MKVVHRLLAGPSLTKVAKAQIKSADLGPGAYFMHIATATRAVSWR